MKNYSVVILGAGLGLRMQSSLPKVLHNLSGKPLIYWVIDCVNKIKPDNIIVVLSYTNETIKVANSLSILHHNVKIVYQKQQFGSAHALLQTKPILQDYKGIILVISADVPLIEPDTLLHLIDETIKYKASAMVLTTKVSKSYGYGRIIKNNGILERIVEESDATITEKQINEINSGIYCFDKELWSAINKIKTDNTQREYYLTDVIHILKKMNKIVSTTSVKDSNEVIGINNKLELAEAETKLNRKKIYELLASGVKIIDIASVYISYDARIGCDTIIYPGVFIGTNVSIGKSCVIQGNTYINETTIGDKTIIMYSYITHAIISNQVKIGPFSNIRPDSILKTGVKIGNFSEIKKSVIEMQSKVGHLSYIGDAYIGNNVNIGAGTITCNYDGYAKHSTTIGNNSFIGSNVNLIAPIQVGSNTLIAAGSTVSKNISSNKLVIAREKVQKEYNLKHYMTYKNIHKNKGAIMDCKIIAGNANISLATNIAKKLNINLTKATIKHFSDGEIQVKIIDNIRGADCYVVQPTCYPEVNEYLMELLIIADALRRASAMKITAIIPYYGYGRQDRKSEPRVPITARLIANLIAVSGITRVMTMDLHAGQIQGFFDIPVDHLRGKFVLAKYFKEKKLQNIVVVSPDAGGVERARSFAKSLNAELTIIDKRRPYPNEATVMNIIGNVCNKTCIIVDDIIDTANTLIKVAEVIKRKGATRVFATATHGILSNNAQQKIQDSCIDELVITDSIPLQINENGQQNNKNKIVVLSVASLFAEAILRIKRNESISALFQE
jgi:UDP-N-acetylglucosamine diphosphorylase/glucosamine-1-phosphate N-acetyltransferase